MISRYIARQTFGRNGHWMRTAYGFACKKRFRTAIKVKLGTIGESVTEATVKKFNKSILSLLRNR